MYVYIYIIQRQDKVYSENNVPKGVKDLKSSGVLATRRPVLNDLSSNLQNNQNANQKSKITITKPTTRLATKYGLLIY